MAVYRSPYGCWRAAVRPIDGPKASDVEFAWLHADREPPPRAMVWLGCWEALVEGSDTGTAVMYEPSGAGLITEDGEPVVGHMTTFTVGYVAFQVFTVDYVATDEHHAGPWNSRVPPSLKQALPRIWPTGITDLDWPPPAFANEEWRRLVTWDGYLRPNEPS